MRALLFPRRYCCCCRSFYYDWRRRKKGEDCIRYDSSSFWLIPLSIKRRQSMQLPKTWRKKKKRREQGGAFLNGPRGASDGGGRGGRGGGGVLYTYVANEEGGGGVLNNVHFALHGHRRTQNDIQNPKYFKTCLNFLELYCFLVASTCQLSAKRIKKQCQQSVSTYGLLFCFSSCFCVIEGLPFPPPVAWPPAVAFLPPW